MGMTNDRDISKFMSYVLRHAPQSAGLTLDDGGWCDLADLTAAAPGRPAPETILQIIKTSEKQRFALSPDGQRIRANQGHSLPVDLGLTPQTPPDILYHGTALSHLPSIWREGLRRGARQHVHLSPDAETARRVGMRHGKPQVLIVAARKMQDAGHLFLQSSNGVWLTERVPPCFLRDVE